jgi:hypothetical protein
MYTVPSGKRLILKEVCLQNLSGVAAVAGIGDGATHGIYQSPSVAAGTVLTIALWEVFNDGDTLKMIITAQPWTIRASGQLLDAP